MSSLLTSSFSGRVDAEAPESHWTAPLGGLGSRQTVGNLTFVTNVSFATFSTFQPCLNHRLSSSFPVFPSWQRPTLEPKSVFLCSEVCVLLVPFAWGQALFSVEVLRIYPNVQDLGVSARLSESGGTEEKRHFISDDQKSIHYI